MRERTMGKTLTYKILEDHLVDGTNTLQGNSDRQVCQSFGWGQWGWYQFTLRVFYDPAVHTERSARSGCLAPRFCPTSVAAALLMPQLGSSAKMIRRMPIVYPAKT